MYRKIFPIGFIGLGCFAAARYFLVKSPTDDSAKKNMSVMGVALRKIAPGVVDRLNTVPELERQLSQLRNQIEQAQQQLDCYERELDESRRLNLRAAEVLEITYAQLIEPENKNRDAGALKP